MARKRVGKVVSASVVRPNRTGRPVRLDLTEDVHERIERAAKKRGLNKSSLVRMVILAWLDKEATELSDH